MILIVDEVVTEVDVYFETDNDYGFHIAAGMTIKTSLGNVYGPYGSTTGELHTSRGSRLNGFKIGYTGDFIRSIGFIWNYDTGTE